MSDFFYTVFPTVLSLLLFGIISVLAYNHETTLLVYRAIFKAFPFFKKWKRNTELFTPLTFLTLPRPKGHYLMIRGSLMIFTCL